MTEFLTQLHSMLFDPERIPYAIAAILLTAVIGVISGPLLGNAGPLSWLAVDKTLGRMGDRLDRTKRPRADLLFRGFILTALSLGAVLTLSKYLDTLITFEPAYGITEVLILCLTITSGSVWFALLRLYKAVEQKQIGQGAFYAIAQSARLNLSIADDFGVARAAMTYSARSFDKGLVAPVLWYLIGGLPLALAYALLAALAWRFGKDGFTKGFGLTPLALERLMGFIPSLFAAILITLASLFTPTARLHKGLAAWLGHKSRAGYEQGGYPLSALAWSLNLTLGGAFQDISGSALKGEWVGPDGATAQNDHTHLRRALFINIMAHILFLASLCGAYLWA